MITRNINTRTVFIFLLIAFGFSWSVALGAYLADVSYQGLMAYAIGVPFMLGPGVAALVTQRWLVKKPLQALGFEWQLIRWQWIGFSLMTAAGLTLLMIGVLFVLGNGFGLAGFGNVELSVARIAARTSALLGPLPPAENTAQVAPGGLLLYVLGGGLFGAVASASLILGEELGWRGLLLQETQPAGFWKSNLIIGTCWGVWHAPLILQGHNYPGIHAPVAAVLTMTAFCVCLSPLYAYLRYRSGSLLAPVLLHGYLNATAPFLLLITDESHPLLAGPAGLAGILSAVILSVLVLTSSGRISGLLPKKPKRRAWPSGEKHAT